MDQEIAAAPRIARLREVKPGRWEYVLVSGPHIGAGCGYHSAEEAADAASDGFPDTQITYA